MKLSTAIFAFYMLALSLVPCGDGGGGIVELANHLFGIEHQHFSSHDDHSNNCSDDSCSPFCVCSCCSSIVDVLKLQTFVVKSVPAILEQSPLIHSVFISSSYLDSIWQPPKFS